MLKLKLLGWSRKEIGGCDRTRRVLQSRVAIVGGREHRRRALRVRRRDGLQRAPTLRCVRWYAWSRVGGAGILCSVARNQVKNVTLLCSMTLSGMGPSMAVEGVATRAAFEAYVEQALAPSLSSKEVVEMDNLSSHKGGGVRKLVEGRGCEVLCLPPYSPEFNPIEEAFSKVNESEGSIVRGGVRTRESCSARWARCSVLGHRPRPAIDRCSSQRSSL